jgi:hypothetical protein
MFMAVVLPYHVRILVVRADAAYFNYQFLDFVCTGLGASVNPEDYRLIALRVRAPRLHRGADRRFHRRPASVT